MGVLLATATAVSFVLAPIVGYMNLKNVTSSDMASEYHPSTGLRILTYTGVLVLSLLALYYGWLIIT